MWLNDLLLVAASLLVGFLLGWVVGRPKRWGAFAAGETSDDLHDDSLARGA